MILLSTAYFPNIQYFSKLANNEHILIEQHENYQKKSYRNRCEILGANGVLTLSVPIEKSSEKIKISEVKIDYSENWQKNHLKALEAAYGLSPFYEFYIDDIKAIFETKHQKLFYLNKNILDTLIDIIGIDTKIEYSKNFIEIRENENDFRFSIHPKKKMQKPDNQFIANKYFQTFFDKFEFIPNLSILDLVFNLGPECLEYLHKTKKTS
jgi:hypothetical protein